MELEPEHIHNILKRKNVKYLYHADTVLTSQNFIKKDALISRENLEQSNSIFSVQKSDNIDKQYGINNFNYLDPADLSVEFGRPNLYGPVLFVFNVDIVLHPDFQPFKIYKTNPINWSPQTSEEQKYYQSENEFDSSFKQGNKLQNGRSCLMSMGKDGEVSFAWGLEYIIIDDPGSSVSINGEDYELKNVAASHLFEGGAGLNSFLARNPNVKVSPRISALLKHHYEKYTPQEIDFYFLSRSLSK